MNTALRHGGSLILTVLAGLAAVGCAMMRPHALNPPVTKLVVTAPFTASSPNGQIAVPGGEYRAAYHDDENFYYQAPGRVVVSGPVDRMFDGGVYIKHGTKVIRGWYYIDQDGEQIFGRLESPPPATMQ